MADVAGQPRPDLIASGEPRPDLTGDRTDPNSMGFFELLRRLEDGPLRFGRTGGPEREPARLGQRVRMAFATGEVAGFHPATEAHPARVDVEVIGLLGPEGAMPLHMTRWIMQRLSERWFANAEADATSDTTFLDFCNLLQHRMMALYWRAWGDARPEVQVEHGAGGRVQAVLDTLAGVGLPGLKRGDDAATRLKLRHATSLGHQVHGVERLGDYLADVLQAPVQLVEFVGSWTEIPTRLQTRLGKGFAGLGASAVIGSRTFQRQTTVELRVGPLTLAQFNALSSDAAKLARLRQAIRHAVGRELEFDLRLVLARAEIPDPRLGIAQLGRTTWLSAPRDTDASDLRIPHITRDISEAA